jgi:hypothetical protein
MDSISTRIKEKSRKRPGLPLRILRPAMLGSCRQRNTIEECIFSDWLAHTSGRRSRGLCRVAFTSRQHPLGKRGTAPHMTRKMAGTVTPRPVR